MVDRFPSYHGEMKKGKPHGRGTKTWPDGTEYRGEFALGKEVPEALAPSERYLFSAVNVFYLCRHILFWCDPGGSPRVLDAPFTREHGK